VLSESVLRTCSIPSPVNVDAWTQSTEGWRENGATFLKHRRVARLEVNQSFTCRASRARCKQYKDT